MTPPRRKLWLDWQRGLAVLFMIEVHVLDAWLASDARSGAAYHALRMLGGFAAPGFLYMAGLSQALADGAAERKGVPAAARRTAALRRALWLLGVAYGFRAVELVVGGAWRRADGWTDLVRVDVLNVIAVGLVLSALLSVGRPARTGALLAGAAALAIALATPVVADVLRHYDVPPGGVASEATRQAPNRLVDVLLAYLYASWPRANFHLFNWAGFLLAGAAVARARRAAAVALARGRRGAARARLLGGPLAARLRVPALLEDLALLVRHAARGLPRAHRCAPALAGRSRARARVAHLLGRQSLVAYIASVELTYGALASPLKGALSFPATVFGISAMAALTWAIALAWERYRARRRRAGGQRGPGGAGTPLSRAGS